MAIVTVPFRVQHTHINTHTELSFHSVLCNRCTGKSIVKCLKTDYTKKYVTCARSFQSSFWPQTYAYGVVWILVEQVY